LVVGYVCTPPIVATPPHSLFKNIIQSTLFSFFT
jgi:hypothetical protein